MATDKKDKYRDLQEVKNAFIHYSVPESALDSGKYACTSAVLSDAESTIR